jgi:hypothetical protein
MGPAAEARLQSLGIPGSRLVLDAVGDGASGAMATTTLHPVSYFGQRMWAETVQSLRVLLENYGWEPMVVKGADLVVHRARGIALIVTAGDGCTGKDTFNPQVRYDRGDAVRALVGGHLDTLFDTAAERPVWQVWFLLHYMSKDALRVELSLPAAIGRSGWVTTWAERIILPEQTFGDHESAAESDPDEAATTAVEVNVRRRAG